MEKNKNVLIGGLLAIVLVMAVGYAAFATQLQINGTASVSSTWDVHITGITPTELAAGQATGNKTAPTYTATTATFDAQLMSPGDSVTYTVSIANTGSINAKVKSIGFTASTPTVDDATAAAPIYFTFSGLAVNDQLAATTGTTTVTVVAHYKSVEGQGQPTTTSATGTLNIEYEQAS